MRSVVHPPDAILRAYGELVNHVFIYLRARSRGGFDGEELFDLADAMHNVGGIFMDYGGWTDDEKYRERYIRPFDQKWGEKSIRLEGYIESRLQKVLNN
jgi:hypothetical protein